MLGATPAEIVFTAGGSDGDTLAVRGAALANPGTHVITQVTEHPAVLAAAESLERLHGYRVTRLPVDRHGRVDPADLAAALDHDTVLVSVMHANNETGTVQPVRELARLAHAAGALFHTDASQSAGKLPVAGLALEPSTYGGGQEGGLRAGTENVALIVALGEAARLAAPDDGTVRALRDLLADKLSAALPGRVHLNGHPAERLPNTLNVTIDGVAGDDLLAAVPGLAASTGSACHAGVTEPSPVLTAMGVPGQGALRLTLGRTTTRDEIETAAKVIAAAAR
jgi:cysteine desulfurase